MPKRTSNNLRKYKQACQVVYDRAGGQCENTIDGVRCQRYIVWERATYTNFGHLHSRAGKTEEWVRDPENFILVCIECHHNEHQLGIKLKPYEM